MKAYNFIFKLNGITLEEQYVCYSKLQARMCLYSAYGVNVEILKIY